MEGFVYFLYVVGVLDFYCFVALVFCFCEDEGEGCFFAFFCCYEEGFVWVVVFYGVGYGIC